MLAGEYRTAKWEMYSRIVWLMCGFAGWKLTEIIPNSRNALNVNFWPGAEAVQQWPAAETETFMGQIPSAGRRFKQAGKIVIYMEEIRWMQKHV